MGDFEGFNIEDYSFYEIDGSKIGTTARQKIENGSILTIGKSIRMITWVVDQHFNWFQKLMWKLFFGIKVEDFSGEVW